MNAVINRILVEMRNNRVTKKELPGDVAEMGGIRDDWVVKKRRLITRSKAYGSPRFLVNHGRNDFG